MKFSRMLLTIGLAIIGFWVVGILLNLAKWIIELALIIGLVLVILSIINNYWQSTKKDGN